MITRPSGFMYPNFILKWVWPWSFIMYLHRSGREKVKELNSALRLYMLWVIEQSREWKERRDRGKGSKVPSSPIVPCCAFASVVGTCQIVFTLLKDVSPLEAWEWMENSLLQQSLVNHSAFILLSRSDLSPARRTMAPWKIADEFDSKRGLIHWARQYL